MAIKAELTYRFVKSGNLVRAVSPTNYGGRGNWRVVRIDSAQAHQLRVTRIVELKRNYGLK